MTDEQITQARPRSNSGDKVFGFLTKFFAFFVFILLAAILISLIVGGWDTITKYGFSFIWTNEWDPGNDEYGALVPIIGTIVSSLIALIIAVPASFGIAMFLTELAPVWIRKPIGIAVELLAAVPSIIYGMWGFFVFIPLFEEYILKHVINFFSHVPVLKYIFSGQVIGSNLFTSGLVLSIMIIPFIASSMRDVFEVVPPMLKESCYGLGGTTWEVMWKVVLPYTREGVIGGIMLGLGRALGETMAVTFVIGNSFSLPTSLFSPSQSIASAIANEFNESAGLQRSALLELGLILFLITTIVLIISRIMLYRASKREGKKS